MTHAHLTRNQVRRVDRVAIESYGMSSLVLMENAGRGCAEWIDHFVWTLPAYSSQSIVILCGKGNNAGDGYVIARHLELRRRDVTLVSLVPIDQLTGDALANANIASRAGLPMVIEPDPSELQRILFSTGIIVDCLLGTGSQGAPREPFASAVRMANHASGIRIAIDVPTGLDCDTGEPSEATFRADHTLTFVSSKQGFASPAAEAWVGEVHVVPIGIPLKLVLEAPGLEDEA